MVKVGSRFLERADSKALRHLASTQSRDLREDEPHPVSALRAALDFGECFRVRPKLRIDEALEIETVAYGLNRLCRDVGLTLAFAPVRTAGPDAD